jgi:nitroreductase
VFVPLEPYPDVPAEEAARRFAERMASRRSVRMFSDRPVSRATMEWIVRAAAGAPSGANKQPWRFVCVQDPALKREIRRGAEEEERLFYARRAPARWLEDLAPLGTDADKAFLETAPWLVAVFRLARGDDGSPVYYGAESVGIAVGLLLAAAHHAGLATLTHTPSPMAFLNRILGRPDHERPFVLVPVGYPAAGCTVPAAALRKKTLDEVMVVR